MIADDSNLVDEQDACPLCKERKADMLVWDEEGAQVTCSMCGCTYTPKAKGQD